MNQDDQDDHPDTPIIILGIRMTFGGGGGGLSSGAEGMQPIILVTVLHLPVCNGLFGNAS